MKSRIVAAAAAGVFAAALWGWVSLKVVVWAECRDEGRGAAYCAGLVL